MANPSDPSANPSTLASDDEGDGSFKGKKRAAVDVTDNEPAGNASATLAVATPDEHQPVAPVGDGWATLVEELQRKLEEAERKLEEAEREAHELRRKQERSRIEAEQENNRRRAASEAREVKQARGRAKFVSELDVSRKFANGSRPATAPLHLASKIPQLT